MKWQTLETVRKAAKRSEKAALRATIVHWRQLCRATPTELIDDHSPDEDDCALCVRFEAGECGKCPVNTPINQCTLRISPYRQAWNAFRDLDDDTVVTSPEWKRWQKASRAMLAVLEGLT